MTWILNDTIDYYIPPTCPKIDPSLGWKDYVSGELKISNITDTHNTIMKEPHLNILLQAIQSELQKIQNGIETSNHV